MSGKRHRRIDCEEWLRGEERVRFPVYGNRNYLDTMKEDVKKQSINNVIFKDFVDKKYVSYILSKVA